MKWFAVFMSVVYIIAGCVLLFTDIASEVVSEYRTMLGAVLIGYGVVRGGLWLRKQSAAMKLP